MERDSRVDVLRSLAILLIMLAHVMPQNLLFQLRTFDVSLMVFLMGTSYVLSKKTTSSEPFFTYVWKRFKRLIIPTWIFLTIFFIIIGLEYILLGREFPFSKEIIFTSYSLKSGIGYVWIIRIFFIIAILSKLIYILASKCNTLVKTISVLLLFLLVQFFLCTFPIEILGNLIPIFGYTTVAFMGMKANQQDFKTNIKVSIVSIFLFIIFGLNANFGQIQLFKYPPAPYYLSYGIMISMTLYTILSIKQIKSILTNVSIFKWISSHSLELYFWHIFVLVNISLIRPETSFRGKIVILVVSTFLITALQVRIFPNLLSGRLPFKKYLK